MADLGIETIKNGNRTVLKLSGAISATASFPPMDVKSLEFLVIELQGVSYINSYGVRRWITWLWNIEKDRADLPIIFRFVPSMVMRQMALIRELVPRSADVQTFYVPFYCQSCDSAHEVLAKRSSAATQGALSKPCPKCRAAMEPENRALYHSLMGPFELIDSERQEG